MNFKKKEEFENSGTNLPDEVKDFIENNLGIIEEYGLTDSQVTLLDEGEARPLDNNGRAYEDENAEYVQKISKDYKATCFVECDDGNGRIFVEKDDEMEM